MQRSRQLLAMPLNAGLHKPPEGGWIKLSWEERCEGGTRYRTRVIQVSRARANQAIAALERKAMII